MKRRENETKPRSTRHHKPTTSIRFVSLAVKVRQTFDCRFDGQSIHSIAQCMPGDWIWKQRPWMGWIKTTRKEVGPRWMFYHCSFQYCSATLKLMQGLKLNMLRVRQMLPPKFPFCSTILLCGNTGCVTVQYIIWVARPEHFSVIGKGDLPELYK